MKKRCAPLIHRKKAENVNVENRREIFACLLIEFGAYYDRLACHVTRKFVILICYGPGQVGQ